MIQLILNEDGLKENSQTKQTFSLTKVMVAYDLPCSTVTDQTAFGQQDLPSTPEFERAMDRC